MTRSGIRIADLFDEEIFEAKLRRLAYGFQKRFGDLLKYSVEDELSKYKVDTCAARGDAHRQGAHCICRCSEKS
jgi:adenylosuccinate synthase